MKQAASICVSSLHILALHSGSFIHFCLLTWNLWEVGLDSGCHVWAKQSQDRSMTYIQSLFSL